MKKYKSRKYKSYMTRFPVYSAFTKYYLTDEGVRKSVYGINRPFIRYSDYDYIIISNGDKDDTGSVPISEPMYFKNEGGEKLIYPYISIHKSEYALHLVKRGYSSSKLKNISNYLYCFFKKTDAEMIGICWMPALAEILRYSCLKVYILSDVYERFKKDFDQIFAEAGKTFELIE